MACSVVNVTDAVSVMTLITRAAVGAAARARARVSPFCRQHRISLLEVQFFTLRQMCRAGRCLASELTSEPSRLYTMQGRPAGVTRSDIKDGCACESGI